ncbi:MAG: beta-lactamase family protein [Muribaculaceae bacterium]|nr:beta-lactamase family protein [Muribaculaceae bacterium]
MKKIIFLGLAIIMLQACTGRGNKVLNTSKLQTLLDSVMERNYTESEPGAVLLIALDGNVVYSGARGVADMETNQLIDKNTNFNIASISKQFTAVAILQLQEKGLLSIDDNVARYFPEFKGKMWQKVKLRHLMSQSSGVPDARPRDDRDWMIHATDDQSMQYMTLLDSLKFEPGTAYDYVNPTFVLLSRIVEKVSGEEFEQYMQNHVFGPARMDNVRYFAPDKDIPLMAHAYIDDPDRQWHEVDYGEETFFATRGDGGIYTSADNMLRWENALRTGKVLSDSTLRLAYTPQVTVTGSKWSDYQNRDNTSYGFGWFIDTTDPENPKVYHTGDNGGFQAYVAKYPTRGLAVIMLENRNDHSRWLMQTEIERIILSCYE